jgi:acetyltransferase-like isoleucine patch superfamily enzyme
MISKILNLIKQQRKNKIFHKNATITGNNHVFGLRAGIALLCGSTKEDVEIKSNVWIYGNLVSQNHGKIYFGKYSKIGFGSKILSVNSVYIGDYTAIADNTTICDNNNHPVNPDFRLYMRTTSEFADARMWKHSDNAPIVIGKNCWIGTNVRIQKGVTIGDNSIVAACSVVTKSIPANCIAAGNPAKVVKTDIDKIPAPTSCQGYNEYVKKQQ